MPTGRAEKAAALALVMALGLTTESCRPYRLSVDGSRLDVRLTGARSPEEIEATVLRSVAEKYGREDMTDSYRMYHVTNGPARWLFVRAYNAPRGLDMFNLYCYEREGPDLWLLRAYVPVNAYYYTNSLERKLDIQTDDEYVKVVFRGVTIFTSPCRGRNRSGSE